MEPIEPLPQQPTGGLPILRDGPTAAGDILLRSVRTAVDRRWSRALSTARRLDRSTVEETVQEIRRLANRDMTVVGAAAGGTAAMAGLGTVASLSASAAELGLFATRITDLILAIGAAHGHIEASSDERQAWVLAILAYGDTASMSFETLASGFGRSMGRPASSAVPAQVLRRINTYLGGLIAKRFGASRTAVALGRALPFGIGAVIGGGANYFAMRSIGRQADDFFRQLERPQPPGAW